MTPPRVHFAVAGPIGQITGGYIYDRRIAEGLEANGQPLRIHALLGAHPAADAEALAAASDCVDAVRAGEILLVDGLALPAFLPALPRLAGGARLVALVHHPLADETGVDAVTRRTLDEAERAALARAARVIVTSDTTAAAVAAMGVPRDRIGTVRPGVDRRPEAAARRVPSEADPVALLCVATITPRKGHALLVEALAGLDALPWRLDCVGSDARDPATVAALRDLIARHGLDGRVLLHGERPAAEMAAAYAAADLFVLPSYHEGFGMAFAEALTQGLPVVGTTAGAIPETVPGDAGILVPPGDVPALREALRRLLTDRALLHRLGQGATRARFPTWSDAADAFARQLELAAA